MALAKPQLDARRGTLVPSRRAMPPSRRKPPAAEAARPTQPGREGKVQIKAWVEPALRKRVKGLALKLDTSVEDLIITQLEALLCEHKM